MNNIDHKPIGGLERILELIQTVVISLKFSKPIQRPISVDNPVCGKNPNVGKPWQRYGEETQCNN